MTRDDGGKLVREALVKYVLETCDDPKPSHVVPWGDMLSEWDKEADRRIFDAVCSVVRMETLKEAATVIMNGGDGVDRMEVAIRLGPNAAIAESVLALAEKPLMAVLSRERQALQELREHLEEDGGATCDINTMHAIIRKGQGES